MCIAAAEAAAQRVVLMTCTQGKSILHSVCFPVLHLPNKVYGSSMENVCCFPFFFFFFKLLLFKI